MRELLLLLVCLASLSLLSSHPTVRGRDRDDDGGVVGRSRPRRQVSEIVRLYNEMVEENRKDREQALSKIRGVLGKVFVSPNDTMTTLVPPVQTGNSTETDAEAETTQKPAMKIDRVMLLANLRRNLRGLGRLLMRELRTALSQSRTNFVDFGAQVRDSIRSVFRPRTVQSGSND